MRTSTRARRLPAGVCGVLGGSAASGRATETSDLDILVVLPGEWSTTTAFVQTTTHNGRLVEAFVYGPDALQVWLDIERAGTASRRSSALSWPCARCPPGSGPGSGSCASCARTRIPSVLPPGSTAGRMITPRLQACAAQCSTPWGGYLQDGFIRGEKPSSL
ncbi:nucleotidyltransferase domain-containing protein [Microbacterium barkeri]|uniref:nucleotidyltransferase domain-containing protein n=1 Tax=Microbacterium barkeri TaxID=33917 RepID=UPI0034D96C86